MGQSQSSPSRTTISGPTSQHLGLFLGLRASQTNPQQAKFLYPALSAALPNLRGLQEGLEDPPAPPRQGRITHSTQLPQLDRTQDLQHSMCTVRTTGPGTCLTDCKHHLMGTVLNLFWFAFQKCDFYLWITQ